MLLDFRVISFTIYANYSKIRQVNLNAITFVIITLLSGAIAGTILGAINQALVEPYIDRAISIETQNVIKEGQVVDSVLNCRTIVYGKKEEKLLLELYWGCHWGRYLG